MTRPRFDAADIRRYYDRHTPRFIAWGQGGRTGAIRRAVWAPGVGTRRQAFHYVDDRIAELARTLPTSRPHLVDLGCGVGASLCYLAGRMPMRGTGITLSPVQARLAADRIRRAGLSDRVRCLEGDYCAPPPEVEPADLACAIESFVHGPAPVRFVAACARLVRPGGLLIVCDDFRRPTADSAAARAIDRFCRGWHINTLVSREELLDAARTAGFEHLHTDDLSPALEIGRVRDRAIGVVATLAGRLPIAARHVDYLIGGRALQECLARGWIGYDLSVFRRL